MALELILQGLTKRTHADAISEILSGHIDRAILSVAFISQDGVEHIETLLKRHANKISVYAGIRNDITSYQALKRLLEIGVSLFAVDTGTRMLLFHPKLYYARSGETAKLTVGSANLTLGGLNNNIEAGVLISLSLNDADDLAFATGLETSFGGLANEHPDNVFLVKDVAMLNELLDAGRLIDEAVSIPPRKTTRAKAGSKDLTPRMKMLPKALRGKAKAKKPAAPVPMGGAGAAALANLAGTSSTISPDLELVWESKPLSRRSLGIPTGKTSNPTGSTTLGSGTFDGIDRVKYFRNDLFGFQVWAQNGSIETTDQEFDLVIKGVLLGTFVLTLRHSLTRAAAAPKDHNSPTSLSWNEARPLVAREDLLGRTMRLWRSVLDPEKFQVEID